MTWDLIWWRARSTTGALSSSYTGIKAVYEVFADEYLSPGVSPAWDIVTVSTMLVTHGLVSRTGCRREAIFTAFSRGLSLLTGSVLVYSGGLQVS